jgi:hypothetical protein
MDLLARAFGEVHRKYPHARLVLKGIDTLYDSKGMLIRTLETLPVTEKQRILVNMRYSGAPFSFRDMALLYQAADVFVSPYRAEGFNIPALEAAACGLPVICTRGGPTDDFVTDAFALKINSRKTVLTHEGGAPCYRLDPDVGHLTALMMSAIEDTAWRRRASAAGPAHVCSNYTWDIVAENLIHRLWAPSFGSRDRITASFSLRRKALAKATTMQDRDFAIASLLLQDQQRLIAAGKVQRWDVVKWTVAFNLALATASVSIGTAGAGIIIVVFTVLVALGGWVLVRHYNRRVTGARRDADKIVAYFRDAGIDLSKIIPVAQNGADRPPEMYDTEELYIFGSIIALSILPALLAWLLAMVS